MNLKHSNTNQSLELKITHDYCAVKKPRLTVIFIHGIATDSSSFSNTLRYLEGIRSLSDVRFIAFDLLGVGASYKSEKLNYDYKDQLTALYNAISKLNLKTPLVLVGHSMGTLIVTRYAELYKDPIKQLILISPPIYTNDDLENPIFKKNMKLFREVVSLKNQKYLEGKTFDAMMDKIVADKNNYKTLAGLKTDAVLIYGDEDQLIGLHNIKKILRDNPDHLTAIKTAGGHSVSHEKYSKIVGILEEVLNEAV